MPEQHKGDARYRVGWKHGFLGLGIDPDLSRSSYIYCAGFVHGMQLKDYLDGYFFFDRGING